MREELLQQLNLSRETVLFCEEKERSLSAYFQEIDRTAEYNQWKVLEAMQACRVAERHFTGTTGYGHNDDGRDTLEQVYARIFKGEDALVRPQIISGTHALTLTLAACLRPGDEVVFAVGLPYDTLQGVMGFRPEIGSLAEYGVVSRAVPLTADKKPDPAGIRAAITDKTRLVEIQRSRGYDSRESLSPEEIGELIRLVRSIREDIIIMVDNCYGEFVREIEPGDVGADLTVGSLIKNPGGGLAPIGGYVVGRADLIERCAARLTAPGIGKDGGATLGVNRSFYQGLFLDPSVTAAALKTAVFAAEVFESLGFEVHPRARAPRQDIVQAVECRTPEGLLAFCRGIQKAAPVDAYVTPEASPMPGYDTPVVMASGGFVSGASIELSADGPLRSPYTAYFQGGLTWAHGELGIMMTVEEMRKAGQLTLPRTETL